MDSCAFMNGQLQHFGPISQTPQAASHRTHNAITNHQAGTTNNSYQYRTVIHGAQPPQSTQYNFHNGAHSDEQASNWQTSAGWQTSASEGPHQVVSSQQTQKWNINNHCLVAANQPNQSNNTSTYVHQYSSGGHQGSTMNLTAQTPSNRINSTYVQQQLNVNKRQTVNTQNLSNGRAPQGWYQNANCVLKQAVPTTTSSVSCEQMVYTSTLASATRHSREAAQNQIPRQNNTQNQFPTSIPPPPNAQTLYNYIVRQRTHNSPPQLNRTNGLNRVIQQQVLRHKMAQDRTYKSSSPPAYSVSPPVCSTQQFVSNARATGQSTPPVPSVVLEHHNLNSIWSLPLHSEAGNSRAQHAANPTPQQNAVPNIPCVPGAGERSGKIQADDTVCLNSKRLLELLLTSPSQLKQQYEKIASTNSTQHKSSKMAEKSDMHDGSIHMSHGHAATRAVAVVQPLSQESYQMACQQTSNTTKDALLNNPEKVLCSSVVTENKESSLYTENPDQIKSREAVERCSSSDGSLLSSSDSGPPKSLQTSDLNVNISPAVQMNAHSEMPPRQTSPEENDAMETFELSSLPVTECTLTQATHLTLLRYLVALKKSEQITAGVSSLKKILEIYWNNSIGALLSEIRTGCHRDVIVEAEHFCKTHVTPNSVILRQVKLPYRKHLTNFYILKDNDVYSEPSYKSSWLNVNEQLDDIDKEFGFPQTMTFHSDQSHQATTVDSPPASTVSEEPIVLSQAEPELTDLSKEESSSAADASTQPLSPNTSESNVSSDPHYSFKIQVLSPEEAKLFFGQTQSEMPQIMDVVGGLETVSSASVESEKAEDTEATLNESNTMTRTARPEFCCVTKWMESLLGSDSGFTTACDCKKKQSEKEGTDSNLEKEDEEVQTQIIDLTEDDDRTCSSSDGETKNSTSLSSIILKSEDENPSSSDGEISSQLLDFSVTFSEPEDYILEQLNCIDSDALINRDKQTENTNDEGSIQKSDTEEGCGEAKLESSGAAESPQQTEGRAQVETPFSCTQTRKRLRSEDGTTFKNALKKRRLYVDHNAPQDKSGKMADTHTVELTLFGSTRKGLCGISGDVKKSPDLSLQSGRDRPPRVLSVNVSSCKKKSSDPVHREGYSVKQWLHESWKRSFAPTKHSHRNKLKTRADVPSSRVSPKKDKLLVSSQQRVGNGKDRLKKQRLSFSNKRREKTKRDVTRGEPEDHKGSNTKDPDAMPVKSMLKFSVLSETFDFKEGSKRQKKESTCPGSDKPAVKALKEKNRSSHETHTNPKGTWCTDKRKRKRHPPSPVPKTTITFQEFKKKHNERTRSSTNQ